LTNLLPAGLQDFFQALSVSNATTTVNKLPRSNSSLGLSVGYSAAAPHHFSTRNVRINALSSLVNGRVFTFTCTTSAMTSHRMVITAEYLNAHFFFVFLFVYALKVLMALFYVNFRKLG